MLRGYGPEKMMGNTSRVLASTEADRSVAYGRGFCKRNGLRFPAVEWPLEKE